MSLQNFQYDIIMREYSRRQSQVQNELEELFKCKVDLISLGAIMRPLFKKNLERDAVYV